MRTFLAIAFVASAASAAWMWPTTTDEWAGLQNEPTAEAAPTAIPTVEMPTATPTAVKPTVVVPTATPVVIVATVVVPTATAVPDATVHDQVLALTNAARREGASCAPYPQRRQWAETIDYTPDASQLVVDERLSASAQVHAEYMARTADYRHQKIDAILAAGGQSENIAWIGTNTLFGSDGSIVHFRESEEMAAQRFVDGWLESAGHCHNLMQPQWNRIGIGIAVSENDDYYGVQLFGR